LFALALHPLKLALALALPLAPFGLELEAFGLSEKVPAVVSQTSPRSSNANLADIISMLTSLPSHGKRSWYARLAAAAEKVQGRYREGTGKVQGRYREVVRAARGGCRKAPAVISKPRRDHKSNSPRCYVNRDLAVPAAVEAVRWRLERAANRN
jgi:hypothetical protein